MLKPPKALALKISPEFLLQIKVAMNTSVVSNVSVDIYCTTIRPQNFERGTWNVDQFERLQYSSGVSVSYCILYSVLSCMQCIKSIWGIVYKQKTRFTDVIGNLVALMINSFSLSLAEKEDFIS